MIGDLPFHVSRGKQAGCSPMAFTVIDGRAYFLPGWPARTPAPSQPTAPTRHPPEARPHAALRAGRGTPDSPSPAEGTLS